MSLRQRIATFLPRLVKSAGRFPVCVVIVALHFCFWRGYLNEPTWLQVAFNDSTKMVLEASLGASFIAALAGHLFAEANSFSKRLNFALSLLASLCAASIIALQISFMTFVPLFILGLILLLLTANSNLKNANQNALWFFNLRGVLSVVLAVIASVILYLGLNTLIQSIFTLFDIDYGYDTWNSLWDYIFFLALPLYFLSLIPVDTQTEFTPTINGNSLIESGANIVVSWLLVPLSVTYAVILHAYVVKIIIQHSLPKGEIATMVSLFIIGSVLAWIIAWPWRNNGTWLVQKFTHSWHWMLPVPLVLLAIGIWRRIGEYGVTPDRYAIILVLLWGMWLFFYFLWRRNKADFRAIIMPAAMLALLGSFGPQGAHNVTGISQIERMQTFVNENNIKDGNWLKNGVSNLNPEVFSKGRSMLEVLRQVNQLNRVESLGVPGLVDAAKFHGYVATQVTQMPFSFYSQHPKSFPLTAKRLIIGPFSISASAPAQSAAGLTNYITKDTLVLSYEGKSFSTPLSPLVKTLATPNTPEFLDPLHYDLDHGASLIITGADGLSEGKSGEPATLNSISFWLVLP